MDSSVLLEDRIWFLRVCHHIPFSLYRTPNFTKLPTKCVKIRAEIHLHRFRSSDSNETHNHSIKFCRHLPSEFYNEIRWNGTKQDTISFTPLRNYLRRTRFHAAQCDSLHYEDTSQAEFQPKYGRCRYKFIIWTHFHDAHTCSKTFVHSSYTGMGDNPTNCLVAGAGSRTDACGRHMRRSLN